MSASKTVALDTKVRDSSSALFQGAVRGVMRFAHSNASWWILFNTPPLMSWRGFGEFEDLPRAGARGIITFARRWDPDWPRPLQALGIPIVVIGIPEGPPMPFPHVHEDGALVGQMAARYFLDLGFCRFAFITNVASPSALLRLRGFAGTAAKAGYPCSWFDMASCASGETTASEFPLPEFRGVPVDGASRRGQIGQWLGSLPKPLALLACTDAFAESVVSACESAGLAIPGDIALMGCGNNPLICDSLQPSLSSVDHNAEQIGFEAARMLDRLIDGAPQTGEIILVPPRRVVTRVSSDILAFGDPAVVKAVRFINRRLSEPIGLDDVVSDSGVSCASLERRFRRALGRSVANEILRQRLERAKQLMIETDLSISQIAALSGFRVTYFRNVFSGETGVPPAQWRRKRR